MAKKLTAKEIDKMAQQFGEQLSKQPKVKVIIPIDPLNPKDDSVPVCINGYTYQIKRNTPVDVPETVAQILQESGYLGGTR